MATVPRAARPEQGMLDRRDSSPRRARPAAAPRRTSSTGTYLPKPALGASEAHPPTMGQAAELEACAARLSQAISAQNQQLYKQRPKTERGRRTLNLSSGLRRKNGRWGHGWRPAPGVGDHRAPAAAYGAHCGNAAGQERWQRRGSTVTSPSHRPRLRPEQAAGGEHVPLSLRTE